MATYERVLTYKGYDCYRCNDDELYYIIEQGIVYKEGRALISSTSLLLSVETIDNIAAGRLTIYKCLDIAVPEARDAAAALGKHTIKRAVWTAPVITLHQEDNS